MPRIQINVTSVLVHNNRNHSGFKYKNEKLKDVGVKREPGSYKSPGFTETSPNHKFYRFKKKDYSGRCCESFALPDDPIYSDAIGMFTGWEKSKLDVRSPNPQDLCCVNLNFVNEPWLIETHEVITPYWSPDSLFSFNPEEIRRKAQLEEVDTSTELAPDSQASRKGQTTINIQNSDLNNVDITALKDHVIKAIEEVIKSSSKVDMKIEIVANSKDESSFEVRVNDGRITAPLETRVACAEPKENFKRVSQAGASSVQNIQRCKRRSFKETKSIFSSLAQKAETSLIHKKTLSPEKSPCKAPNGSIRRKRNRSLDNLEFINPLTSRTSDATNAKRETQLLLSTSNATDVDSQTSKKLREQTQKYIKSEQLSPDSSREFSAAPQVFQSPKQRKPKRKRDFSNLSSQSKRVLRSSMKNGSLSEYIQALTPAKEPVYGSDLHTRTECDDLPRLVRGDLEGAVDYDEKCLLISNGSTSQEMPVDCNQDECPILALITDDSALETSLTDQKERISPVQVRKSKRTFKPVDKLDMLELERKFTPIKKEIVVVDDEENLDVMPLSDRLQLDAGYGDIGDKVSETGSKASSDLTSSSLYSFEYQVELHKQNNLFHRLKNVKVCDHCFRQGELHKCKGKCGGSFHMKCLSDVGRQPVTTGSLGRKSKPPGSHQKSKVRQECEPRLLRSRRKGQCEIVTVKPRYVVDLPNRESLPGNFHSLSLTDQIDYSMQEVMRQSEQISSYIDISDSSSDVEFVSQTTAPIDAFESSANVSDVNVAHVTADSIILSEGAGESSALRCTHCRWSKDPPCFSCGLEVNKRGEVTRRKCSLYRCGRFYHPHCLKAWPQTQWSIGKWSKIQLVEDDFTCPAHRCHTCFSEELGSSASCRLPGDKLARCLLCPSAFHATTFCTPAGSEILGGSQIICPRHKPRKVQAINTGWCFICSEGGNLVCCDTCPTSVHPECQPVNLTDDDKYICEDCESGRFPLYDEVVWVKLGQYRWWPALILFPNEVPLNLRLLKHNRGDFVVRFFGTNDHYWVNKARSFLFQEGDSEGGPSKPCKSKNKVYLSYTKSIQDAEIAYRLKKEFKLRQEAESIDSLKPPAYIRINKSKPVGNVKCGELDLSNATACECNPQKPLPCGADSNCINRLLMTECDPNICRAGIRCRNQAFQKREYSSIAPYKTQGRGWGLKALSSIKQGRFIIEYVGELIDSEEYQRRIRKMHEKKEDNYYFMTVDSDRVIDAGPKGNLSRFMNHSCDPNCVTQKWTVLGETRVGLFAKCDIDAGSELTFNYNFEVVGQEKKVCKCGAQTCSGFIGGKVKLEKPRNSSDRTLVPKKRKSAQRKSKSAAPIDVWVPPCFVCGGRDANIACNSNLCQKSYHLRCLNLQTMPKGKKYTCPRHNCKICFHRTNRCCVMCLNSYCAYHANGHIRYDRVMGFVCYDHDPINAPKTPQNTKSTRRKSEAESRSPKSDDEVSEDDLSLLERLDRSRPN